MKIEKVRTLPQQMKNASNEAIYQLWLGRQDSNLRMLGPKPSALPLGDDPNYAHYTTPTHSAQLANRTVSYIICAAKATDDLHLIL